MKVSLTEVKSGYKGEKKVSRFSEKSKSKIIIASALICAFLFVLILSFVGVIPVEAAFTRLTTSISGDNDRFPIYINSDSTLYTDSIGDNIIILTTKNVAVYSPRGKLIYSKPHVYGKPGLNVNDDKAVVFDRNGKGFMLLTDKKLVYTGEAEGMLISAKYGKDGSYALGTKAKKATSALTVYDKNSDVKFKWNCAYENIASIALSDNGRYIGVAVMGAENGEIFTTVHYFGVDYKDALNTQKIIGSAPFELKFTGFNRLTLITNDGVYNIDKKADKFNKILSYYPTEFNSFDVSKNNNYVVTLAKYGSENVFEIHVLSPKGKQKAIISAEYEIKSAYMSNKYIFALAENHIMVYNLKGKEISKISYRGEAYSILPTDNFTFIVSLDKINRCFSYGDSSIELGSQ